MRGRGTGNGEQATRSPGAALRRGVLLLLAGVLLATLAPACGGGGESADEVTQRAFAAINQPGMVFHAKGDDGSEVWIDAEKQVFRRVASEKDGGLISVGDGWQAMSYDPYQNAVSTKDSAPPANSPPRINHPAVQWLEALGALAYSGELRLIGETTADGKKVVAIEARSPVLEQGQFTGRYLVGRIELDAGSYFLSAFERRLDLPLEEQNATPDPSSLTPQQQPVRILYQVSELVPRETLPAGFFDATVVEDQIITLDENIAKIKALGIDPYWLGKRYEGGLGAFRLPGETEGAIVDTTTGKASFHYQLEVPGSAGTGALIGESLVVNLGPAGTDFGQPVIQEFGGVLPEQPEQVTVRGQAATLYRSVLTPAELPCPTGAACPKTKAPLYYRLPFAIGKTVVQLETYARVDSVTGDDQNGYNSTEGIAALAEALTAATATAE